MIKKLLNHLNKTIKNMINLEYMTSRTNQIIIMKTYNNVQKRNTGCETCGIPFILVIGKVSPKISISINIVAFY